MNNNRVRLFQTSRVKLILLCCFVITSAHAKELTVTPSVDVNDIIIKQTITPSSTDDIDLANDTTVNTNSLNLDLLTHYRTRKVNFTSVINGEYITRQSISGDEAEDPDAFLQLNLLGDVQLWQDKLSLSTELSRSQQSSAQKFNIGNPLIGGSEWFDVNRGAIALNYNSRLTKNSSIITRVDFNKTQADPEQSANLENISQIDTESTSVYTRLGSLTAAKLFQWSVSSQLSKTNRASLSDLTSGSINLESSLPLSNAVALNALAEQSVTQIDGNSSLSNQLEYKQVGVGLKWISPKQSELSITVYNASSARNNNEIYVGGTLSLNISQFSKLSLEKSKNSLGQADTLSLLLQGKRFRFNANYTNSIDISTQQGFGQSESESFLCPIGVQDISQCFINNTLTNINTDNFFQTSFTSADIELSEQISNSKSLNFNLGYDSNKKIKASVNAELSQRIALENNGQSQETLSYGGLVVYRLNSKADLKLNVQLSQIKNLSSVYTNEQQQINLSYNRKLGQDTHWNVFIKHSNIDSQQLGYLLEESQLGAAISIKL